MKKYLPLLIAFMFIFAALPALGETEEKTPLGAWYADLRGLVIEFEFEADGTYRLAMPAKEAETGTWVYDDGYVILDGKTRSPLNLVNEGLLLWTERELFFFRDRPEQYAPADMIEDAELSEFYGYWVCVHALLGDQAVPASSVNDNTDLFVDGETVALGGPRFGDVWWNFTFEDGRLSAELNEGERLTISLQQDGMLRLDISGSGAPATLWLSAYGEAEEAEGETEQEA